MPSSATEPALFHSRPERLEHDLGLPRLFREELAELVQIVLDECQSVRIDFYDDRGTFGTSPQALEAFAQTEAPETLDRLTISGARGSTALTLTLGPGSCQLVVENPDNGARGAAERIREICRRHSPRRFKPTAATAATLLLFVFLGSRPAFAQAPLLDQGILSAIAAVLILITFERPSSLPCGTFHAQTAPLYGDGTAKTPSCCASAAPSGTSSTSSRPCSDHTDDRSGVK